MSKKFLKIIGLVLIILGILTLISAFPFGEQTAFRIGPIETDIPQISASRIILGVVETILGLIIYFGKDGLKIISNG